MNQMNQIDQQKKYIINGLKNYFEKEADHFQVQIAFLYGSWARGFPKIESDVDVAVLFSNDPPEEEGFERVTGISLVLSERIGRDVIVIAIYRDFRKPMLYYNAVVMGIPVYIKDSKEYMNMVIEAVYQAEDFEIFGLDWQRTLARKNLEKIQNA